MDGPTGFVDRFESAIAEFVILDEVQRQGSADPQDLATRLTSRFDLRSDTVAQACERLAQDGHLAREGGRYRITDDGREDVRKLERIVQTLPRTASGAGGATGGTSASGGNLRRQGSDEPSGAVSHEGSGGAGPSINKPGAVASRHARGADVREGDTRRGDQTSGR